MRIGATTSNRSFDPLAFENADGGMAVVIKADAPGEATIRVPPGEYIVEMALDGIFLSREAVAGEAGVTVSFPSKGYGSVRRKAHPAEHMR